LIIIYYDARAAMATLAELGHYTHNYHSYSTTTTLLLLLPPFARTSIAMLRYYTLVYSIDMLELRDSTLDER